MSENVKVGIADPPLPFNGGRYANTDAEIVLARRRVLTLLIIAPALSFAMLLLGFEREWPLLAAAGVIGFGVTALAIGGLAMAERRLVFIVRSRQGERRRYVLYEGPAAVPFGGAYVVAGLSLIVPAVLFVLGASMDNLQDQVLARPSYALIPAGAFLFSHGLGFLIGFVDRSGSRGQRIFNAMLNLPGRLGGLILLFWGAVALAVGIYEWLLPAAFDGAIAEIARGRLPFVR
jgi:hypothetical protein